MIENYAAGRDLKDPFISPLFGDLKEFPPTCIQAGDNEMLLSDATRLYKKLIRSNVPAKIDIYKGMWHVFQMLAHIVEEGRQAVGSIAAFVDGVLRNAGASGS